MPLVGFEPFLSSDDQFAYRPAGGEPGTYVFFYPAVDGLQPRTDGVQHLASMVKTGAAVHAVHGHVRSIGDTVLHDPQDFPQYPPPYFALFWLDPFGIKLEAVCHFDR